MRDKTLPGEIHLRGGGAQYGRLARAEVAERRRESAQVNRDGKTKSDALADGAVPPSTRLLQVSPGDEQLLKTAGSRVQCVSTQDRAA